MSARKTENYQLNQWEASDQVLREDFNRDNTLLDSALALLAEQVSTKAETSALNALSTRVNKKADMETLTAVLQKLNLKADSSSVTSLSQTVSSLSQTVSQKAESSRVEAVAASVPNLLCGSYTGNGSESRFISLGFTPKAVLVVGQDGSTHYNEGHAYHYGGLAITGGPSKTRDGLTVLSVEHNGFTVYYQSGGSNWLSYAHSNSSGRVYYYIAIG